MLFLAASLLSGGCGASQKDADAGAGAPELSAVKSDAAGVASAEQAPPAEAPKVKVKPNQPTPTAVPAAPAATPAGSDAPVPEATVSDSITPGAVPPQRPVAPSAPPSGGGAATQIELPPMLVQADAMAIVNRAIGNLSTLRSIDCVTWTEQIGVAEEFRMSGLGLRRRVQLRFERNDSVSMPLMRIVHLDDTGKPTGTVAIYDGRKAILLDDRERSYFDPGADWVSVIGPNLPAIPRWYLVERATVMRKKNRPQDVDTTEAQVIGARILRTEELDGTLCDVVEVYKSQPLFADAPDGQIQEIVNEIRHTETIHYARTDGMPRRFQLRMLTAVNGGIAFGETTVMEYSGVVINEGLELDFFKAVPPEGYVRKTAQ